MRFYAYPPTRFEWPYIILSLNTYLKSKSWKAVKNCTHLIVDSGVDKWFFLEKLSDYPEDFHKNAINSYKKINDELGDKVTITIPDYPDDYTPGQTHENGKDNVDKTIDSIKKYTTLLPNLNWMPVAQAKFMDYENFVSRLSEIAPYVDRYGCVAIGTVCKVKDLNFIGKCCRAVRREFPDAKIHAFGATLNSYPIIRNHIDSFDSTAYSWQGTEGRHFIRNQMEREMALTTWLLKADAKISLPVLESSSEFALERKVESK